MHKLLMGLLLSITILLPGVSLAGKPISKQQAATIAKSRFQGRVIAVDEAKENSTEVYRVKVLDQKGGMHTIVIDNQSGNVISAH